METQFVEKKSSVQLNGSHPHYYNQTRIRYYAQHSDEYARRYNVCHSICSQCYPSFDDLAETIRRILRSELGDVLHGCVYCKVLQMRSVSDFGYCSRCAILQPVAMFFGEPSLSFCADYDCVVDF